MSFSDCAEDSNLWDYKCPQFCDLTATESEDQLRQIDHFFELDHEKSPAVAMEGLLSDHLTPDVGHKSVNFVQNVLQEDGFTYETPPQNKENTEEEDNEVFYSTKKYLSVEKTWKLRSTPMRILQYNGNTPLREPRISSKKKKKSNKKSKVQSFVIEEEAKPESPFAMNSLRQSLPVSVSPKNSKSVAENDEQKESIIDINVNVEQTEENQIQDLASNEPVGEHFEDNEPGIPSEPIEVIDRRLSFVIETKKIVGKTVKVVSPAKQMKTNSTKKQTIPSSRRKGTPIRRSVAKVNTASVVARLYSTAKKRENTYKSMAELLKEFETQPRGTDRSRSLDRPGSAQRSRSSSVSSLTRPQSPKFHSIQRYRPIPRKTEDIIASAIKKYSFKANPIRKKLFDPKFASGIPRVKSAKVPTKAVEMHFLTEKRHEVRAAKHSTDEEEEKNQFHFKANPMPLFKAPQTLVRQSAKKPTTFRPFRFDHQIQELISKKRFNFEGSQPSIQK